MSGLMIKAPAGGLPTVENLAKAIQHTDTEIGASGGGVPLLRLTRAGFWAIGPAGDEPEENAYWAVNPYTYEHGFIAWEEGSVMGETMCPITQPRPHRNDLKDGGAKWDEQYSVQMQCVSGEDVGLTVLYKTTSVGGKRAVKELLNALGTQLAQDPEKPVAVIALDADSYQHKTYGQTFIPVFEVQSWSGLSEAPEAEAIEAPEEAPKLEGPAEIDGEVVQEPVDPILQAKTQLRTRRVIQGAAELEQATPAEQPQPTPRQRQRRRRT